MEWTIHESVRHAEPLVGRLHDPSGFGSRARVHDRLLRLGTTPAPQARVQPVSRPGTSRGVEDRVIASDRSDEREADQGSGRRERSDHPAGRRSPRIEGSTRRACRSEIVPTRDRCGSLLRSFGAQLRSVEFGIDTDRVRGSRAPDTRRSRKIPGSRRLRGSRHAGCDLPGNAHARLGRSPAPRKADRLGHVGRIERRFTPSPRLPRGRNADLLGLRRTGTGFPIRHGREAVRSA